MVFVRDVTSCSTSVVSELDRQLIAQINLIVPNVLVSFIDLGVDIGEPVWPLLQPPAKVALQRAISDRGRQMVVNSAYRTIAQQLLLFNHAQRNQCGITIAALPGLSNHQSGLALDVEDAAGWEPFLERHGWRRLLPQDPVHFDYIGTGTRDIRSTAVRAFQQLWNLNNTDRLLTVDGSYGPQTQTALNESPIEGFPKGDRIPLDVRKRRLGSRVLRLTRPILEGDDVRELQIALNKVGFNLEVDGYFGPATDEAVRKFQTDKGLVVDGIVGPTTLEALNMRLQTAA